LKARNGNLAIKPQKNGPLLVSGNMEMISGTGRTFRRLESAALCRCGASASKPFCDGSHARVGFTSENAS
jgi:CDGSH-type Zn-finger protein